MTRDSKLSHPASTVSFRPSVAVRWLVLPIVVGGWLVVFRLRWSLDPAGLQKVTNAAIVAWVFVEVVRAGRAGVIARPEQLVVYKGFRTYWIRWSDITNIEMPGDYKTWRIPGVRIHLVDGRVITATLYPGHRLNSPKEARAVLDEFDQLRRYRIGERVWASADLPCALPAWLSNWSRLISRSSG